MRGSDKDHRRAEAARSRARSVNEHGHNLKLQFDGAHVTRPLRVNYDGSARGVTLDACRRRMPSIVVWRCRDKTMVRTARRHHHLPCSRLPSDPVVRAAWFNNVKAKTMRTVEVSRVAMVVAVAGMILASSLGGCVVREHTEEAVPYPVMVGGRSPAPWYGHGPRPWFAGPSRPWVGAPSRPCPPDRHWKYTGRGGRGERHGLPNLSAERWKHERDRDPRSRRNPRSGDG